MSPAFLEAESTLTERYQTTVPEIVRRVLRLNKRDKIHYVIRTNGEVVLKRSVASEGDDPALGAFLEFLARDIADHPERLLPVDVEMAQRITSLTEGIEIDLDAPISADDE